MSRSRISQSRPFARFVSFGTCLAAIAGGAAACGDAPAPAASSDGDALDASSVPDDESVEADATSAPDPDTTAPETAPVDVAPETSAPEVTAEVDTTPDTPETIEVVAGCVDDTPCKAMAGVDGCNIGRCVDRECELVSEPDGTPCEDGDLCTTGDTCDEGWCAAGAGAPICPPPGPDMPCSVAACFPTTGCGQAPAAAGTACDNGRGTTPGTCMVGGFLDGDRCDGEGKCVDAIGPTVDSSAPALDGNWFAVHTTFGAFAPPGTSRALFDISSGSNAFVVSASQSSTVSPFSNGAQGFFCTREDGTVEGRIGVGRMLGHQVDESLAVAVDPVTDGIALMLRADEASSTQVSGRYAYFQTTLVFRGTSPTTWRGSVEFNAGCLVSGAIATDPAVAGAYEFVTSPADCLTASTAPEERGLYRLLTKSRALVGDPQSYPIDYRGAIGRGGDVLVFVKEQHLDAPSLTPEYGVVILVRDPAVGPLRNPAAIAGEWVYNLQVKLGGDLPRRDVGSVEWTAAGTLIGTRLDTLDGARPVSPGWYLVGEGADTFRQRVIVGGVEFFQAGFVAPSGRFAVGWNVSPPPVPSGEADFDDLPRHGSMLLMLRP